MTTTLATATSIDASALVLLHAAFGNLASARIPLDLNRIAEYCRIVIRQGDFQDKTFEGALERNSRTVFLSAAHPYERKTFTLAHELGHLNLHEDVDTDVFTRREIDTLPTRDLTDSQEYEADLFAACLLMPQKLVRSLWAASGHDPGNLAKIFGVPPELCHFRLTSLQLAP